MEMTSASTQNHGFVSSSSSSSVISRESEERLRNGRDFVRDDLRAKRDKKFRGEINNSHFQEPKENFLFFLFGTSFFLWTPKSDFLDLLKL